MFVLAYMVEAIMKKWSDRWVIKQAKKLGLRVKIVILK